MTNPTNDPTGTSSREPEVIRLHDVVGFARKSGIDEEGMGWSQVFYAPHDNPPFVDCNSCPSCDADWSDLDDLSGGCPSCGLDADALEDLLRPACVICGKPVYDGWSSEFGDEAHDEHIEY